MLLSTRTVLAATILAALPCFLAPLRAAEPVASINENLAKTWKANGLKPTARCSDHEYLRRVSLDLLGRCATLEEVTAFEKDARPDKRARLVDALLKHEDYARYWAEMDAADLLPELAEPAVRAPFTDWLREQTAKNVSFKDLATRLLTATGKTSDHPAALFLVANRGTPTPDAAKNGVYEMEPATSQVARVFVGKNSDCTSCHDHPFVAEWKQEQFWALNGFFRQTQILGDVKVETGKPAPIVEVKDNAELNKEAQIAYLRRNGKRPLAKLAFVDGQGIAAEEKRTRREVLAELVVKHENFARVQVNRYWSRLFGRSLHQNGMADDFSDINELVHPELLKALSQAYTAAQYDNQQLIRWLCASDAYQLRSAPNDTNAKPEAEQYFSRLPVRELTAQERLDSLLVALNARTTLTQEQQAKLRNACLVEQKAAQPCPQGCPAATSRLDAPLNAAAFMISSDEVQAALAHKDGPVAKAVAKKTGTLDDLYRTALNRLPTPKERALIEKGSEQLGQNPDEKERFAFWQDVFWVLLNTNEFSTKR